MNGSTPIAVVVGISDTTIEVDVEIPGTELVVVTDPVGFTGIVVVFEADPATVVVVVEVVVEVVFGVRSGGNVGVGIDSIGTGVCSIPATSEPISISMLRPGRSC